MSEIDTPPAETGRTVNQTGRSYGLRLRRTYDTSPMDMWDAWTSPDRLRRWLGEVTGDLSEGGTVTLDMGAGELATITIVRCDPPRRLVVNWSDPNVPDTSAQLLISPDGRAILDFEHLGYPDTSLTRSFGEGWEDFLDRLGQLLAGTEVKSLSWEAVVAALDPHWKPLLEAPTRDDRWPKVTVGDGRATLAAERICAAPPATVWDAITDPVRLGRWFADVEIGDGEWRAVFTNGAASGTIKACTTGREIVTTWKWDHEDTGSVLHVTLEPVGAGTRVQVNERDAPTENASGYAAGWYAMLNGLAIHLDGREPTETDWDADFALARRTT